MEALSDFFDVAGSVAELFLFLFSFCLFLFSLRTILQGRILKKLQKSVSGKVISSEVIEKISSNLDRTRMMYRAAVNYQYEVNGNTFLGNNIYIRSGVNTNDKWLATNLVRAFPAKKEVEVYFDPRNPQEAWLKNEEFFGTYILLFTTGVLSLVGAWLTFF